MLSKAQGLGKKTAERIVIELKDKVLPKSLSRESIPSSKALGTRSSDEMTKDFSSYQDAISALLTLGYKATDADQAVRKASEGLDKKASTEQLIRRALGR